MSLSKKNKSGFTVVEILIVMVIFGIFMVAVYSLYISQLKTTFNRDEMLEVQQNVRIAMERLTKDMRMAGFLISPNHTTTIVSPAVEKTFSSYTTIKLLTASADATFGSINNVISDSKFSITPNTVLNNFTPHADKLTIVRPSRGPNGGSTPQVFDILSSSSGSATIAVSPSAAADSVRTGDMICKATKYPDTIEYKIDRTNECANSPCLKRNSENIAQGIRSIQFDYFIDGENDKPTHDKSTMTDDDFKKISAIRVTVVGMTGKTILKNAAPDPTNSRSLTTLIKLRNYRK